MTLKWLIEAEAADEAEATDETESGRPTVGVQKRFWAPDMRS